MEEWGVVKTRVENGIERVTHKVEGQKVKAQTYHRFSLVIDDHLRVKRNRPGHKVDPSYGMRYVDNGPGVRDDYSKEEIKVVDDASGV